MGTRSLTLVVQNHEVKVARYEQSDGYPEALGVTLLHFLKEPTCVEILQETLPKVRLWNQEDQKQQDEFLYSIGCENGILNLKQKEEFQKQYPFRYRERFGKLKEGQLLELLLEFRNEEEIVTGNDYEFAKDSLFCEWAYVIDFDKNSFEVYKGLNTLGISEEDRFFSLYDGNSDYYPVKIKQRFPLGNLPNEDEFVLLCKKP